MSDPQHLINSLDMAFAEFTPGVDLAVRFVSIDQVDMLAEFYLNRRRADLATTDAQIMVHPKVLALVDAARPFDACMFNDNGDVTISTGHLSSRDWLRLRAALRDLNPGEPS